MATCEDCISKNVCELYGIENDFTPCQHFKDRKKLEEKKRPKTNADKIRSMTDEEISVFLNGIVVCHTVRKEGWCKKCSMHEAYPCDTEGIINWLKLPVEEV